MEAEGRAHPKQLMKVREVKKQWASVGKAQPQVLGNPRRWRWHLPLTVCHAPARGYKSFKRIHVNY